VINYARAQRSYNSAASPSIRLSHGGLTENLRSRYVVFTIE